MNTQKLDILVMSIELSGDAKELKFVDSGRHSLTFDEIKDTIRESIDIQFDDFESRLKKSENKFDSGVIIMPLVKINFKK